jgi:hypothetical protein
MVETSKESILKWLFANNPFSVTKMLLGYIPEIPEPEIRSVLDECLREGLVSEKPADTFALTPYGIQFVKTNYPPDKRF